MIAMIIDLSVCQIVTEFQIVGYSADGKFMKLLLGLVRTVRWGNWCFIDCRAEVTMEIKFFLSI